MKELREHNECLLLNILPAHVAQHFLERDRDNEVLSPVHRCVGVYPGAPVADLVFVVVLQRP